MCFSRATHRTNFLAATLHSLSLFRVRVFRSLISANQPIIHIRSKFRWDGSMFRVGNAPQKASLYA